MPWVEDQDPRATPSTHRGSCRTSHPVNIFVSPPTPHVWHTRLPAARSRLRRDVHRDAAGRRAVDPTDLRRRQRRAPASPDECDGWIITGAATTLPRRAVDRRRAPVRRQRAESPCPAGRGVLRSPVRRPRPRRNAEHGPWKAGPQAPRRDTPMVRGCVGGDQRHAPGRASIVPASGRTIARGHTAEHPMSWSRHRSCACRIDPEYDAAYIAGWSSAAARGWATRSPTNRLEAIASDAVDNGVVGRWIANFLLDRRRIDERIASVPAPHQDPLEGDRSTASVSPIRAAARLR